MRNPFYEKTLLIFIFTLVTSPTYRQVKVDHFIEDATSYPPPPPPDTFSKGYGYDAEEEFPPPPPPAPPQAYSEGHENYGNVYKEEPQFSLKDDYVPPDYASANAPSPRSSVNGNLSIQTCLSHI